jgi:hypothetical protein
MEALPRLNPELRSELCLLDDEPSWLAHPRIQPDLDEQRNLVLNPGNRYEWAEAGNTGDDNSIIWVKDRAVDSTTPYRASSRLRELIDGFQANQDLFGDSPRTRGICAWADVVIDDDYALNCELRKKELTNAARVFAARGYAPLRGLIHPLHVGKLRLYYRRLVRTGGMACGDSQSPLRYVIKNDPLSRLHHERLTATMCQVTGRKVKPSYVYVSAYQGGARLPRHVDRAQCEYSITLCLDFTPETGVETAWPLHLDTPDGTKTIYQAIGDALIYRGRTLPHYRDELSLAQSSTSVFFHYVDEEFQGGLL